MKSFSSELLWFFKSFVPEKTFLFDEHARLLAAPAEDRYLLAGQNLIGTIKKYFNLKYDEVFISNDALSGAASTYDFFLVAPIKNKNQVFFIVRYFQLLPQKDFSSLIRIPPTLIFENNQPTQIILEAIQSQCLDYPQWISCVQNQQNKMLSFKKTWLRWLETYAPQDLNKMWDQHHHNMQDLLIQKLKDSANIEKSWSFKWTSQKDPNISHLKLSIKKNDLSVIVDLNGTTDSTEIGLNESQAVGLALTIINKFYFKTSILTQSHIDLVHWSQPQRNLLRKKEILDFSMQQQTLFLWRKVLDLMLNPDKKKKSQISTNITDYFILKPHNSKKTLFIEWGDQNSQKNPFDYETEDLLVQRFSLTEIELQLRTPAQLQKSSNQPQHLPLEWSLVDSEEISTHSFSDLTQETRLTLRTRQIKS